MHPFNLLLMITGLLALAACSSQAAANPSSSGEIDPASLPKEIDIATAAALQRRANVVLLDVREQSEYDAGHIPGVTHIPMGEVVDRLAEIPQDKTVIVTCRSGNRSGKVTDFLRQQGYEQVYNMQGGILAWEQAGYKVER